ncbi:hypothetical protein N0V84_004956 [Fusarium piperis]|uniref:Uncharacterized protein n=1 Tax=Fusarium piperis TaxID=1435070 RepID=A0A9W8WEJ1_9HYPO|nr:hypothetical protein N0V84_004956 [Fusarium piperis]
MILSDSKKTLRDFLRFKGEDDGFSDYDYDEEYGTEDEEDEEGDESDEANDEDQDWESEAPRERQMTTPSASRRIFFRIRGCEYDDYDPSPNPGYLDFPNDGAGH